MPDDAPISESLARAVDTLAYQYASDSPAHAAPTAVDIDDYDYRLLIAMRVATEDSARAIAYSDAVNLHTA